MKFEQGQWRLLPGTEGSFPVTVTDVRLEPDALVVMGYDHYIHHRSSYLHGTLITVRFTSPMPDVLRVQITHFKGRLDRLPAFDLDYSRTSPDVNAGRDEQSAWLKTGRLSVVVPLEGDWGCTIQRDGEFLTGSEYHGIGLFTQG